MKCYRLLKGTDSKPAVSPSGASTLQLPDPAPVPVTIEVTATDHFHRPWGYVVLRATLTNPSNATQTVTGSCAPGPGGKEVLIAVPLNGRWRRDSRSADEPATPPGTMPQAITGSRPVEERRRVFYEYVVLYDVN